MEHSGTDRMGRRGRREEGVGRGGKGYGGRERREGVWEEGGGRERREGVGEEGGGREGREEG